MTAASTHDTKRGEDARARINVISELTGEWRAHLARWSAVNDSAGSRVDGLDAPDRNDQWMFYQSLIGAWPPESPDAPVPSAAPADLVERMQAFMLKAIREAKRHTSWLHFNEPYEQAVATWVRAILGGDRAAPFLESFVPFQRRVAWFGMLGSLAQLVLRVGAPGVPDIYQGSELWNLSLVDPDNRRPVDFELRRRMLAAVDALRRDIADGSRCSELKELLEQWGDGRVKLYTLVTALTLRRVQPRLFLEGTYDPLTIDGESPHVVAFGRRYEEGEVIVMVPRFLATLLNGIAGSMPGTEAWGRVAVRLPKRLAQARLKNVFTGETVVPLSHPGAPRLMAADVFRVWPVAMLVA